MTDLNEQFKEFTKLTSDFFKPAREASGLIADSFENSARLNYAIQGDLVDYTIEHTQLVASADNIGTLLNKINEKNKALYEKMNKRYNEIAELNKEFFSAMQKVEIAPIFEAPAKATAKGSKAA